MGSVGEKFVLHGIRPKQGLLCFFAGGYVADDFSKPSLVAETDIANSEFRREGRAIASEAFHLSADPYDACFPRLEISFDIAVMCPSVGLGIRSETLRPISSLGS